MAALMESPNVDLTVDINHKDALSDLSAGPAVKPVISKMLPKNSSPAVEELGSAMLKSSLSDSQPDEENVSAEKQKFIEAPIPKVNPWASKPASKLHHHGESYSIGPIYCHHCLLCQHKCFSSCFIDFLNMLHVASNCDQLNDYQGSIFFSGRPLQQQKPQQQPTVVKANNLDRRKINKVSGSIFIGFNLYFKFYVNLMTVVKINRS